MSYLFVLAVVCCSSSSFERVNNELSLGVLRLLCVASDRFARRTALLSCSHLSILTEISKSEPTARIDRQAELHLLKAAQAEVDIHHVPEA
jgi:hypothetical protein